MLDPQLLFTALHDKRDEFEEYQQVTRKERQAYHTLLDGFALLSQETIDARLAPHDWPGAIPAEPLTEGICQPFVHTFHNHQSAREWAADILYQTPTCAVDGSQLMPNKELPIPVAAVQVGWFINPHDPAKAYDKRSTMEIIGPQELLASGSEEKLFHDQSISLKRYELETSTLTDFLHTFSTETPDALAFFDGSLLVSFAEVLMELHRTAYVEATHTLLRASKETQVPLVGYIDTSVARDLVKMVSLVMFHDPPSKQEGIRDTDIVGPLLPKWGDRTVAFRLCRRGILKQYEEAELPLGFLYMRASMDRPPIRLEFPLWVAQAGALDRLCDLVRAELIVGNGYPYVLETADKVAWISPIDRGRFTNMLLSFLHESGLGGSISNKLMSKRRRR